MNDKGMTRLVKAAQAQGWLVTHTGGGHWKFTPPGGRGVVFAASTPSCCFAVVNTRARLRRLGFTG